ncbi:Endonuclease/exonuclease/phosphatase [Gautieria morchelliformis]|nr:Endonuclease/exonuclease/phosphatase [Gautieria morchelliformis]
MLMLSSVLEETRRLRKLNEPNANPLSPTIPPEQSTTSPSGRDPNLTEGPESSSEPRQETMQLSRADPGPTGEESSEPDHTNIDGDPESLPNKMPEMKSEAERSSGPNPSFESSDSSKNPIHEGEEARYWEWLHFYLSHRASRTLPCQRPKPRDIRFIHSRPKLSPSSAGLPGDEGNDIALIRDHWIDRRLAGCRDEFCQRRSLRLRIGTFNVNGKPPTQSLVPWICASRGRSDSGNIQSRLPPVHDGRPALASSDIPSAVTSSNHKSIPSTVETFDDSSVKTSMAASFDVRSSTDTFTQSSPPSSIISANDEDLPDMFILGLQELDLSTEALLYSTSTLKADAWISAIFAALGKSANDYIKLVSKQLVGVLIVVIVRRDIQPIVKEVSTGTAAVGLMGIMGNKGAAAVRLRLNSTTATFVCAHLAAFDDYVDRRNSDFQEVARKLEFPITWKGTRNTRPLTANLWETDMLFWLVNLNYRIDLPDEEIRTLLMSEPRGIEYGTLLAYDQLRTAIRHKRAFVGFLEHDIKFPPTYRFAEESADQLRYDKKRKPAWTDRLLHMAADPIMVSQKSYESCPMVTLSDHHPVSADYDIYVCQHDPHKYLQIAQALYDKFDGFEYSTESPTVTILDGTDLDLGLISYMTPASGSIRVKNTGMVACAFRFVPLEAGSPICKEWLQVQPEEGLLLPGEKVSIHFTINIGKRTASSLNHGNTRLEDKMIFRLSKGSDYIISVSGSYLPTCFATSLAWLVRSVGPIRTHGNTALLPEGNTLSAPRELMFLIEWLITNAHDVADLFVASADESLVHAIREHMDTQPLDSGKGTDVSFPEDNDQRAIALAYGEALLQFLDSLAEPVIPWVLHPRCALAQDREDAFEILDHVPSFARNVYVTVTAFLHYIAHSGGPERAIALARAFADVLLRDNPRAPPGVPALTPLAKRNFVLYTIA